MAGTIYYTAPEQLKGRATYASDQYSLAMVAFEWLSGKRPFRGSFAEIMSRHVLASPPHLQDFVLVAVRTPLYDCGKRVTVSISSNILLI